MAPPAGVFSGAHIGLSIMRRANVCDTPGGTIEAKTTRDLEWPARAGTAPDRRLQVRDSEGLLREIAEREQELQRRVVSAHAEATRLVEQAQREAERIQAQAREQVRALEANAASEAAREAEQASLEVMAEAQAEATKLRQQTEKRKTQAVNLVVREILGGHA